MDAYDIMLYASYLLAVVGTILSIVMPLLKSLDDPKGLLKSGLGVLGLAVLFFVCYFLSGNEVLPKFDPKAQAEDTVLVRMTRANFRYDIHGYTFTNDHPFVAMSEEDAQKIFDTEEGFRLATPKEVQDFYN